MDSIPMREREKRTEKLQTHVPASMRAEIEAALAEQGRVVSISDFLFEAVEDRLAMRAIRISKQRIVRRVGNQ